ncbi:excisionase family DNA binding protein [Rhizobium sp. PP-F2F-G48]|nr:excisionase family DNA binding protein [Rhizobium sp. PP-F2F-G48]
MKHQEPSAAMSIQSAAKYLSLSRSGIYRLINSGTLNRVKIGGRSVIRRADADALLGASHDSSVALTEPPLERGSVSGIFG